MRKVSSIYAATPQTFDKNDCSIRSLATATGCTYEQASAVFSAAGRRLKKGTDLETSERVYEEWLGMTRIEEARDCRLRDFMAAFPRGKYIVHRRGHAFAVVDGILHDWERGLTGEGSVVKMAWRVTEITQAKIEKTRALFE